MSGMTTGAPPLLPKFKGGGGGPGGVKLEQRIGVQAPSEAIWALLSDLEGWKAWNPLYPQAAGQIRIGSVLTLTLALPGEAHRTIRPVVVDWVPREQLLWRLTALGGLVRTTRYIEIEQLEGGGCILSNGEFFGGLLGPMVARRLRTAVRRGFAAMNEALKAQAETAWRDRGGAPTSDA